MAKKEQPQTESSSSSSSTTVVYLFVGAIVVPFAAAIGQIMAGPNKHLSSEQRNQDAMVFAAVGVAAALGLAAYLYVNKTPITANNGKSGKDSSEKKKDSKSESNRPKDIWNVGQSSQTNLKKTKAVYTEKPFGSKYYYAHNDSNTTGGYKDGLKMEDYRMNGPRLLSVNGLSVVHGDQKEDGGKKEATSEAEATADESNESAPMTRITARDPRVKNITKYLWDDPGNAKGIATIRVDVLPGDKFGEFTDINDVTIQDAQATLPGEGLLAKITVVSDQETTPTCYQLKINKLYGDAGEAKVVIKPKKLLIKIYKKKHGFLSKNNDNMGAWPQPHRKI